MWDALASIVWILGLVTFYAMVRREKTSPARAADHSMRARLVEWIRGRPGIRLSELWRAAGAPRGTIKYHLLVLERAEKIRSVEEPHTSRYFPPDGGPPPDALSALLAGRILEMAKTLVDRPGLCQKEFADALGLQRKTVRHYATRLLEAKLVDAHRDQFRMRYFPTDRLLEVLPMVLARPPAAAAQPDATRPEAST